jgi:hypothetical protein
VASLFYAYPFPLKTPQIPFCRSEACPRRTMTRFNRDTALSFFAGKPRAYGTHRADIVCGTMPTTFSHTRIDHRHDRPPYTETCA